MTGEQTRFGFPPLPDTLSYPEAPPLSTPIAELSGFWLRPQCCGRAVTYLPCRLLAAQHGWDVPLSAILERMTCRACGQRPVSILMTDGPDRMAGDHCGGPEAWTMEVGSSSTAR